jgi:diadenosine tetraphosphatase ApaH/serine/threonine PP2A family protein phosphatase
MIQSILPALRTLIISDVHSNVEGLLAVIADAEARGRVDALWCLGDIVGYGAEPSAVIAELGARSVQSVAGNHDRAATGTMEIDEFNPMAASAALWTRDAITKDDGAWLDELPLTLTMGDFTLAHGSLREPLWEYLDNPPAAGAQFDIQPTPYSIVGHTHIQFWCEEREGEWPAMNLARHGEAIALGDTRLILNPGSTGQPRDGDPRAGYMLYDDERRTVTWHRVEYDAEAAGRKIIAAGLPEPLATRLRIGR